MRKMVRSWASMLKAADALTLIAEVGKLEDELRATHGAEVKSAKKRAKSAKSDCVHRSNGCLWHWAHCNWMPRKLWANASALSFDSITLARVQ